MSERPCSKCGARLPRSEFHADATRPDGLHSWCKPCRRAAGHAHFVANRDAYREKTARWREVNVERAREMARTTHHQNHSKNNLWWEGMPA